MKRKQYVSINIVSFLVVLTKKDINKYFNQKISVISTIKRCKFVQYVEGKTIESPPSFTTDLSDVTTGADNDVSLRCVVSGIPEPSVQWMYNEEVITSEDGVNISYRNGVANLMLEQAVQEDSGCYTCIASNTAGRAMSRCTLIVNDGEARFFD